jgi:PST family polysaccharide transporter
MTLGISEALPQAVGLGIAIWLALTGGGYWALVAQAVTVAVVALILDVLFARWLPGPPRFDVSIKRFLRFGGALAGTQGLAYVAKNIDNLVLGVFYGSGALGFYSRAYQLIVLPLNQLTAPLSRVAIPILARIQDDREQFIRYLRSGQFFTVTLASVFYATLIGLATPVVLVVLGDRWLPVVPILQALAVSGIFRAMGQVPYWIFVALGLTGKQFKIYLISQPFVVVAILVGVPWAGVGVAVGCSLGYFVFWFVQMWWAGRVSGIPTASLIRSGLLLVLVMGAPVVAIGFTVTAAVSSAGLALLVGLVAVLAYTAVMVITVPAFRRQLSTVKTILQRRRDK